MIGSAMHYFPAWGEDKIMNMSWYNFTMYMASIPRYKTEDKDDEETGSSGKNDAPTGEIDIHDLFS